MEDDLRD
jgi:hypothetical protein